MIIHIGYPKCASSFLQEDVFPYLKKQDYFDMNNTRQKLAGLIKDDDLDYHRPDLADGLYSSENLLTIGNPQVNIRSRTARRLKEAGFEKIIICIRSQHSIIDSLYRQFIQDGGTISFNFYLNNYIIPDFLNYRKSIKLYKEIFGAENVHVVIIETLRQQSTIDALSSFIGEPLHINPSKRKNESLSNFSLALLKIINHFISSKYRPSVYIPRWLTSWKVKQVLLLLDKAGFSKKNYLVKHKKTALLDAYRDDNRKLAKELDLPLEKYNYPV